MITLFGYSYFRFDRFTEDPVLGVFVVALLISVPVSLLRVSSFFKKQYDMPRSQGAVKALIMIVFALICSACVILAAPGSSDLWSLLALLVFYSTAFLSCAVILWGVNLDRGPTSVRKLIVVSARASGQALFYIVGIPLAFWTFFLLWWVLSGSRF